MIKNKLEKSGDEIVPGLYNIPAEEYFAVQAVSYTGLKEARKSPAHYQAYLRSDYKSTSSQRLGTLAHMTVLQPELAETQIVRIEGNRNLKANKDLCEKAESEGKITANVKEWDQAWAIAKAVHSHGVAGNWLKRCVKEVSAFTGWPDLNLPVKARFDALHLESNTIFDLKTYSDLTEDSMMRQIRQLKYHWQSDLYSRILSQITGTNDTVFSHIFVEVDDPYGIRVVTLNNASLDKAAEEYFPILHQLAGCYETGIFPNYPIESIDLSLPDSSFY